MNGLNAMHAPYLAALLITGATLTVRGNARGAHCAEVVCRYGQTYSATDPDPLAALAQLERLLAHEFGPRPSAALSATDLVGTLAIAVDKLRMISPRN